MRAFIALDIPEEFADDTASLARQLGATLKDVLCREILITLHLHFWER